MAGIADRQSRHAVLACARRRDGHRFPAYDLAIAEIPVDDDKSAAIDDEAGMLVRPHLASARPIDIFRDADHPVRIVTHKARVDEMRGDDVRFDRATSCGDEDRLPKFADSRLRDAPHSVTAPD